VRELISNSKIKLTPVGLASQAKIKLDYHCPIKNLLH